MKTFYRILENGYPEEGNGIIVPDGFIEFAIGVEPQELINARLVEIRKLEINTQIAEKQAYLDSTDWITSKYNDEVTVLATISKADFVAKYQDIYTDRTQARLDINTLQAELESL